MALLQPGRRRHSWQSRAKPNPSVHLSGNPTYQDLAVVAIKSSRSSRRLDNSNINQQSSFDVSFELIEVKLLVRIFFA